MKKIYSILAIVAIALTSACVITSCEKKDEPKEDPKPEMIPIDSIVGYLEYDYNEVALKLFDIKYEVTDFNGKKEAFTVTEPGSVQKVYKAKKTTDMATVKLIVTAKDISDLEIGDELYIKLATYAYCNIFIRNKFYAHSSFFENADNGNFFNLDGVTDKENGLSPEFIKGLQKNHAGTYEAKISLPEEHSKGEVSKEWFDTSIILKTK